GVGDPNSVHAEYVAPDFYKPLLRRRTRRHVGSQFTPKNGYKRILDGVLPFIIHYALPSAVVSPSPGRISQYDGNFQHSRPPPLASSLRLQPGTHGSNSPVSRRRGHPWRTRAYPSTRVGSRAASCTSRAIFQKFALEERCKYSPPASP